ncbi:flagellar biosynthesis anti-sigma factor FlgM [Biomaibacter acetigenes]|jgi:negative regulator of flagellin synthesis FlgM|uniref:Negative regulator of flagellin synthesis n=1 Tax=Biomaibacter acetigenes TaxID=2316383 RepID=A0A3G2R3G8_9FIRM|nr:flagellar biosynthesis anti-sigma factor FlgM [Biomaibacter acetigenes]AYO29919.1 flagellar biosynthesis anti-sigma factor FlgM [Biomaibacter acetigenes]MDN5313173.1 negative regulator of flagellin synthesis FlgM [Thermoanaerobacteraceae bacterium]RKL64320.1 flagellar biosynthesis anti-sigma factor FlgM [Thermoanaerobacteraceae bacterium SP2]
MNISRSQLNSFIRIYSENGKEIHSKDKEKSKTTHADSISLSAEARELLKAAKSVMTNQEIREEKVALLKEKINRGTYNIDGQLVAEKIIEEHFNGKMI